MARVERSETRERSGDRNAAPGFSLSLNRAAVAYVFKQNRPARLPCGAISSDGCTPSHRCKFVTAAIFFDLTGGRPVTLCCRSVDRRWPLCRYERCGRDELLHRLFPISLDWAASLHPSLWLRRGAKATCKHRTTFARLRTGSLHTAQIHCTTPVCNALSLKCNMAACAACALIQKA